MQRKLISCVFVVGALLLTGFGETYARVEIDGNILVVYERWRFPHIESNGSIASFRSHGHAGTFDGRRIIVDGRSASVPAGYRAVHVETEGNSLIVSASRRGSKVRLLTLEN
jgi:hypothetical protein